MKIWTHHKPFHQLTPTGLLVQCALQVRRYLHRCPSASSSRGSAAFPRTRQWQHVRWKLLCIFKSVFASKIGQTSELFLGTRSNRSSMDCANELCIGPHCTEHRTRPQHHHYHFFIVHISKQIHQLIHYVQQANLHHTYRMHPALGRSSLPPGGTPL